MPLTVPAETTNAIRHRLSVKALDVIHIRRIYHDLAVGRRGCVRAGFMDYAGPQNELITHPVSDHTFNRVAREQIDQYTPPDRRVPSEHSHHHQIG